MKAMYKYVLNDFGDVVGYGSLKNGIELDGTEPFCSGDYLNYKKVGDIFEQQPYLNYKYFLIPSDLVPHIAHYAGFVKEALAHLAFNVLCGYSTTMVEGEDVQIPLYINHIPCSCTHWTEDGLQLLEACVENWNISNPFNQMVEPYVFESYNELIAFRDGQV